MRCGGTAACHVAHAGVGVTVIGIAAQAWSVESLATVPRGGQLRAGPYVAVLEGVLPRTGPNYTETVAHLTIREGGDPVGVLEPGKRFYASRNMSVSEAGLLTIGVSQVWTTTKMVKATWIAARPQSYLSSIGSTNSVQPPSFCGKPIPFVSGMKRISCELEIAASFNAMVRF